VPPWAACSPGAARALSTPWYAALLVARGGRSGSVARLTGHPAGIVALAVAFGAFQLATVVADTRCSTAFTGRRGRP
jgi:hypothetical protein